MKILDTWKTDAKVDENEYLSMYERSIKDNENFWKEQGSRINWINK
mgnify:CR=1 FL=1